jgi:hypothetical protein
MDTWKPSALSVRWGKSKSMKILLSVLGLVALLSSQSARAGDQWDRTTLLTSGNWSAVLATGRASGVSYCTAEATIYRETSDASGFLMVMPLPDGSVNIAEYISDWAITEGRQYGDVAIGIDGKVWMAHAEGAGDNSIAMTLTGYDPVRQFWSAFAYGKHADHCVSA